MLNLGIPTSAAEIVPISVFALVKIPTVTLRGSSSRLSVLKQSVSFSLGCRLIRGNLSTGWLPRIQLTAAPLQFETQGGPFHRAMEGPARCNAPR